MRASVDAMPRDRLAEVDAETRARVATAGAEALNASLTPEQRKQNARNAASAAHSLVSTAKKFAAKWSDPDATDDEKREAQAILRAAGAFRRIPS